MASKTITIQGFTVQEFAQQVRDIVRIELQIFGKSFLKNTDSEYLTRKQTAILLQIDLSTLYDWTKDGKIKSKKVGGRVYYNRAEISELLKTS